MAKKQFKAESKRLLDLMINSIYTHKEIFLREIISNASDAIDKLCYLSLTDDKVGLDRGDFKIEITVDKDARTLTVSDNGIGMDKDELENNLGVIASSGSYKFRQEAEQKEDIDIIGQFGVGFYSAFMVADEITVVTKKYGAETAYRWQSSGADGYTVAECEKDSVGTDVIMHLKADTDEEKYSEYLDGYRLYELVKKYSDYIRYPIRMLRPARRVKGQRPLWGLGQRPNCSAGDHHFKCTQQRRRQRSVPAPNFARPQTRPQAASLPSFREEPNNTIIRTNWKRHEKLSFFLRALRPGVFCCRKK